MACSKDLRVSILTGSEEMFDFFCQPCSAEKHVEAVGYCKQCHEYLCETCSDYHGKLSATKHHKVLDKSNMPKDNTPTKVQSSDVITETCPKHHGKVLEYFCKHHNQVCCSVCLTLNHSSCSDKSYIPDVSGGIANSQEYKTLTGDLDLLVGEITKLQKQIKESSTNNDSFYTKALADIDKFRKQVNELLDKIEEETKQKVSTHHKENSDAVQGTSEKCEILLSEMKSMTLYLDEMAKAGKNNQLFLQVKLSCQRVAEAQGEIKENSNCNVTRYAFYQDEKIQEMVSTLSAIWSLSVRQDGMPTSARYVREVNIKSGDDANDCVINSLCILTGDRMVVTDFKNKCVKLVDMKINKIASSLSLSSKPIDVTKTNQNQVAVALPQEKKIDIFTVSNVLSRDRTVYTPGASIVGLCYDGSNCITACHRPDSVKIIDMSGKTLKTYTTNSQGHNIFTKPRHIAIGRDKDVIYVTDYKANTVTILTTGGSVISVYGQDILKLPDAVAVDKYGSVYVCSRRSHSIHQLSPTGEFQRIILNTDKGLHYFPYAIAYSEQDNRLCISSNSTEPMDKNYIRLYQLE